MVVRPVFPLPATRVRGACVAVIFLLHLIALVCYVWAWVLLWREFREGLSAPQRGAVLVATVGFASHAIGLIAYSIRFQTLPLVGLAPASSTLALAIAAFALAASVNPDLRSAGLFLWPLVVLLLAEALLVGVRPTATQPAFRGPWFVVHVVAVFVGYAGLAVASMAALMYLLQFRALKRKDFGSVFRFFPPLESLDRLNRIGLRVGLPFLTLGILAGWSWTLTFGRGLALEDPATILAIVTWAVYLVAIVARIWPSASGQRSAAYSVVAFFITAAVFFVLRLAASQTGSFL